MEDKMKKIVSVAVILIVSIMLLNGCIDGKSGQKIVPEDVGTKKTPFNKYNVNDTLPIQSGMERLSDEEIKELIRKFDSSNDIRVEGKAMKDKEDYYVVVAVTGIGDNPAVFDMIQNYFIIGNFENRIGHFSYDRGKENRIMPGKSLVFNFTTSGQLETIKKSAGKYKTNTTGFYLKFTNDGESVGEDSYLAYLPPLENLPDKNKDLSQGYTVLFLPTSKQDLGIEPEPFYPEAVLLLSPNATIRDPKTNIDYDYLVKIKLHNNGKESIIFDKITTLIDDGAKGSFENHLPPDGKKKWELSPGGTLIFNFTTAGHTRQFQQTAKDYQKKELYFSYELSNNGISLYDVYITPIPFMEKLPDFKEISDIGGWPLKLDKLDIPRKQ